MRPIASRARVGIAALSVVLPTVLLGAPEASAVVPRLTIERVATWDAAAARLGVAGSLWEPTVTQGLDPAGPVLVRAAGVRIESAAVSAGRTQAERRYGSASRGFRIIEKWAETRWVRTPGRSRTIGRVGPTTVLLGGPAAQLRVRVMVYANCEDRPVPLRPDRVPFDERCTTEDVRRTGGVLTMTARPASDRAAPGETSIVIESTGLSYRQLLDVAASLQQVAGAPAGGAGSAQMVGMCRQMTTGRMTAEQASRFAGASGYLTRVGSIDGQPQAVTADYRPDRFTLALQAGTVVSCTYG